jgi:hypothetical protein
MQFLSIYNWMIWPSENLYEFALVTSLQPMHSPKITQLLVIALEKLTTDKIA